LAHRCHECLTVALDAAILWGSEPETGGS